MKRMITAAVVAVVFAPYAWTNELEIRDVQASFGPIGPERPKLEYYLPSDHAFFRFAIVGAKHSEGAVNLSMAVKLINSQNESVLSRTRALRGAGTLGGDSLITGAHLAIPADLPAGDYRFHVHVTDKSTSKSTSFERKIVVAKRKFAIQAAALFYDVDKRIPASANAQVGQALHFVVRVIGFDASQPHLDVMQRIEIIDVKTKNVTMRRESKSKQRNGGRVPSWTIFGDTGNLNRVGDFILRFTVIDRTNGQSLRYDMPIRVLPPVKLSASS